MLSRRDYLEGGAYTPSEASYYTYGSSVPDPEVTIKRRIAMLQKIKDTTDEQGLPVSENFQRFMAMQNNPEALFTSTLKLPQTPFGNLASYMASSNG